MYIYICTCDGCICDVISYTNHITSHHITFYQIYAQHVAAAVTCANALKNRSFKLTHTYIHPLHHTNTHHMTAAPITSHHITSHHITSHYITPHHITWYDICTHPHRSSHNGRERARKHALTHLNSLSHTCTSPITYKPITYTSMTYTPIISQTKTGANTLKIKSLPIQSLFHAHAPST